ncbi:TPA: relaxase/mobilization nuclease domain-containing protein [Streptococcus suis]
MGIVKIQQVRSLSRAISYLSQDNKILDNLVTYHHCMANDVYGSFKDITDLYNSKTGRDIDIKARMIIQSFSVDDNVTPEQAHEIAKELCRKYFKNEFQYVIYTHQDADHIHNHILFNSVNFKTLKMFDSTRKNTIDNLRRESDKILEANDLIVIEPKEKRSGISFSEYMLKAQGKSFKGKLSQIIDNTIHETNSYSEFLLKMQVKGYEMKQGKYLMFKNDRMKNWVRTKTLGIHYSEKSIEYRIANKDFKPVQKSFINKQWIDKTQERFRDNKGLRRWASRQNIKFYQELLKNLDKQDFDSMTEKENFVEEFMAKLKEKLEEIDSKVFDLKKMENCFSVYQDSYTMIKEYKVSDNKTQFKKNNYQQFKAYDKAKREIYILDRKYNIKNLEELTKVKDSLLVERQRLYAELDERKIMKSRNFDLER